MPGLVAVLCVAVPLFELLVIVKVADAIGFGSTIVLLIGVALVGTWLLLRQGLATWQAVRASLAQGRMPATELIDAALLFAAAVLLLTPGFLTDFVALFLVFPGTRALARNAMKRFFDLWIGKRLGLAGTAGRGIYEANVSSVRRKGGTATPLEDPSPQLPAAERPDDEVGSPDRG